MTKKSAVPGHNTEAAVIGAIEKIYLKGNSGKTFRVDLSASLVNDLGFDSLEVLTLIADIETKLGIQIPDSFLSANHFETPSAVIQTVRRASAGKK